jgi:L-ascorbate metabolism protein UlaG (beta-lactamase superfamily)
MHTDHINADAALAHLVSNPKAVLVGPAQVIGMLSSRPGYATAKSRIRAVTPAPGESVNLTINGIGLNVLRLRHSAYMITDPTTGRQTDRHAKVQNLGFVMDLGGSKIFHAGDSGLDQPDEYSKYRFDGDAIDLAFFAAIYWTPVEPRAEIINKIVKPRNIVLMHLPPSAAPGQITAQQRAAFPRVKIFKKSREMYRF